MASDKMKRITQLAAEFNQAAEQKFSQDPSIVEKLRNALRPADVQRMQEIVKQIVPEAVLLEITGAEPSDEFLKKNISAVEVGVDLFLRTLPKADVAALVPAELKNKADADFLREIGFPILASLCDDDTPKKNFHTGGGKFTM